MASNWKSYKITLDEQDVRYFRGLYRTAKKHAKESDAPKIVRAVKRMIAKVQDAKRVPSFVKDAIQTLEDLIEMIEDEDYALPTKVTRDAVAGLAYFANPQDVVPDHVPGIGYLDDAIMMRLVEEEFKHELWGYRQFRKFRLGAEHRPWTKTAKERLPQRLVSQRKTIREKVMARKKAEAAKQTEARARSRSGKSSSRSSW